jgi:hypothetical protein
VCPPGDIRVPSRRQEASLVSCSCKRICRGFRLLSPLMARSCGPKASASPTWNAVRR